MPRIAYTDEMLDFIREQAKHHKFKVVLRMLNEKYGTNLSYYSILGVCQRHDIKCTVKGKSNYTKEMDKFILDNCKGISVAKLTEMFNEHFETDLTKGAMKSRMGRIGARNELLLHKETHPAINHPNAVATRFKKGQASLVASPIGTERLNADGYYQVKVSNDKWVLKQRFIYQQAYGDLKDNEEIIFLDGDRSNFELSNLMKISKSESVRLNCLGLRTTDKDLTKAGVGMVRLDQTIRKKQKGS